MSTLYSKQRAEHDRLCGKLTTAPNLVRLTSASNGLATALAKGMYRVVCDVDCWYIQCNATCDVTATNASLLPAGVVEFLPVTTDVTNIVAITGGGTGYLQATALTKG